MKRIDKLSDGKDGRVGELEQGVYDLYNDIETLVHRTNLDFLNETESVTLGVIETGMIEKLYEQVDALVPRAAAADVVLRKIDDNAAWTVAAQVAGATFLTSGLIVGAAGVFGLGPLTPAAVGFVAGCSGHLLLDKVADDIQREGAGLDEQYKNALCVVRAQCGLIRRKISDISGKSLKS